VDNNFGRGESCVKYNNKTEEELRVKRREREKFRHNLKFVEEKNH
jgi:hypothetical protein